MNIHIYIEEYLPLNTYYKQYTLMAMNKSGMLWDVNRYSNYDRSFIYHYPVKDDTEYKFNFFRVNPLSEKDIEDNSYENPAIEMLLSLNGSIFYYYRGIPTLDYALYGNVENDHFYDMDRKFYNNTFIQRFGAQCTGNLTVLIMLQGSIPFDLNFAFVLWEVGDIGNGTDNIPPNENTTIPNPFNNDTEPELHNSSLTGTLNEWIANAGLFIHANWWSLFLGMGVVFGVAFLIAKYKFLFIGKIKKFTEKISSAFDDNIKIGKKNKGVKR